MIEERSVESRVNPNIKNAHSKYLTATDADDPVLPALFVFQGMRGSGKTYSCVQMCRHFEKKGYIQRTFLLCPTVGTTLGKEELGIFSNLKTLHKQDVCTDVDNFNKALHQVEQRVREDWDKYETFQKHEEAYQKYLKKEVLSSEEMRVLEEKNFCQPSKPVIKKRHLLILDDCQGSDVYTTARRSQLNHLAIKHRHVPLTICFLVQSWVGVPRTIRLNATQYIIFKTADATQLEQIYSAFANTVPYDTFLALYHKATDDTHGFLYIDVVPKEPHQHFRKGFDTYLIPPVVSNNTQIRNSSKKRSHAVSNESTV